MSECPFIQQIAVWAFAGGLFIHCIIHFAIKKHICADYKEHLDRSKFKAIQFDYPGLIPSKHLTLRGQIYKYLALVAAIMFISSACYIGFLTSENKFCAKTTYSGKWYGN